MSSPSIRKHSASPIRGLDDKSPRRNPKLHTILQEDPYAVRPYGIRTQLLERQNNTLNVENKVLNDKVRNFAEETTRFYVQNSRLRHQNEVLKDWNYTSNAVQIQRLKRQCLLKDAEIEKLRTDMGLLRAHYDRSLDHCRIENDGLKSQLLALEQQRFVQVQDIKTRYNAIAQQDMNLARKGYYDDISKLMTNLEATKALLHQKQHEIKHLTVHGQNLVKQHTIYLEQLVSQNNILRNQILQTQIKKDNQVKFAEEKRELQKSRTHGIIAFCKENTAYIQKQISNLAKELLEKSISIEQFTKDMVKIKRNLEQTQKRYEDRLEKKQKECDDRIQQIEEEIKKAQKHHKQELADQKKIEMELREMVASKQNQIDSLQRQQKHDKEVIESKNGEIQNLKQNLAKLHDDHAKQISKVMTDSRLKRKSMKNLSESSSLRDLSADGNSSIIKKPIQRQNSMGEGQPGSSGQLYTVQQELAASHLVNNQQDDHDIAMHDLVLHYQNIIQDLKNDKALEISLANENIKKLNQNLKQKQQQVLQILERFSPLMEYKINSGSIEEQRKQKIQKHYKANIDILGVMLEKYSIAALAKKK